MTFRSLLIGFLGAAFICAVTYFNDAVMHQTYLVGNNMPIVVYGMLILVLVGLNPMLRLVRLRGLSSQELVVVLALVLAACCIPGSGLMRSFPSSLVLPHHIEKTSVGWQRSEVLDALPDRMLTTVTPENESIVVNGFIQGLGVGSDHIGISEVPWKAWLPTLSFWLPILLCLWIALIGLSAVVHHQWSANEQLPYPIAQFTNSLLPDKDGGISSVFRNRLFWGGAITVLVIHVNNYGAEWFPSLLFRIPINLDFRSLAQTFPSFNSSGGWFVFYPQIYFTVVAFAYFLAADVSLSLGLGPILFVLLTIVLSGAGISLSGGGYMDPCPQNFMNFGAYAGLFLAFLYTGRYYYWHVIRRAYLFKPANDVKPTAAWGARVFLVFLASFVIQLVIVGLDWQLAILYAMGLVIIFMGMGRIIAETGMFFIQPATFSSVMLVGFFGAQALGPVPVLIMMMLGTVILVDPREAMVPFITNAFKTAEMQDVKIGRTGMACGVALVIGLAVAIPTQLYLQYDRGSNMADQWASKHVPSFAFDGAVRIHDRLDATGKLEEANARSGWARFAAVSPAKGFIVATASGLLLVLLFTFLRLRFPKWPLHPVMFLIWSCYPGKLFAISFLIGCGIKRLVTKYGGPKIYRKLKPLMFGLIAGEVLAGLIPTLIGLIYYLVTGDIPNSFRIMPG